MSEGNGGEQPNKTHVQECCDKWDKIHQASETRAQHLASLLRNSTDLLDVIDYATGAKAIPLETSYPHIYPLPKEQVEFSNSA